MNERAIEWADRLPRRWARNAAILAAGIALAISMDERFRQLQEVSPSTGGFWIIVLGVPVIVIVATAFLVGVVTYLIGMAARHRLRTLRDMPDELAAKAIRWLPLRYFGWGLLFGLIIAAPDSLFPWREQLILPWDTPENIAGDIGYAVGVMILMAIFTSIVGFVSRRAFRKSLMTSN
jgi:hypothetical protein